MRRRFEYPIVFPGDLRSNSKWIRFIEKNKCTKIVIAIGQWSASWVDGYPMLVDEYKKGMMADLEFLKTVTFNGIIPPPQVFVRSMNPNSLSAMKITCPPTDWRTPAVVEAYNTALQEVCSVLGINYIDTQFILGPVWDSAPDWSHFTNQGGTMLATYIAGRVMNAL